MKKRLGVIFVLINLIYAENYNQNQALHEAIDQGNYTRAKQLVDLGVNEVYCPSGGDDSSLVQVYKSRFKTEPGYVAKMCTTPFENIEGKKLCSKEYGEEVCQSVLKSVSKSSWPQLVEAIIQNKLFWGTQIEISYDEVKVTCKGREVPACIALCQDRIEKYVDLNSKFGVNTGMGTYFALLDKCKKSPFKFVEKEVRNAVPHEFRAKLIDSIESILWNNFEKNENLTFENDLLKLYWRLVESKKFSRSEKKFIPTLDESKNIIKNEYLNTGDLKFETQIVHCRFNPSLSDFGNTLLGDSKYHCDSLMGKLELTNAWPEIGSYSKPLGVYNYFRNGKSFYEDEVILDNDLFLFKNWLVNDRRFVDKNLKINLMSDKVTVGVEFEKIPFEEFVDKRDAKIYRSIRIGNQDWMAENLNYLPLEKNKNGSWCYNDSAVYCDKYGRLYDWNTAMIGDGSIDDGINIFQGVCPIGWHMPSDKEWAVLREELGGSKAGNKMKTKYMLGNNESGFTAFPVGFRSENGNFIDFGKSTTFWSSSKKDENEIYVQNLSLNRYEYDLSSPQKAYSVRCLKNLEHEIEIAKINVRKIAQAKEEDLLLKQKAESKQKWKTYARLLMTAGSLFNGSLYIASISARKKYEESLDQAQMNQAIETIEMNNSLSIVGFGVLGMGGLAWLYSLRF